MSADSKRHGVKHRESKQCDINLEELIHKRTAELEKANKTLHELKTQFEAVYNHYFQMTGLIDTDGRLLMANRTALEFAGIKAEHVIGKYFWDTP